MITHNMSLWIMNLPKRFTVRSEYCFSFKTSLRATSNEKVLKYLSLLLTLFPLFLVVRLLIKPERAGKTYIIFYKKRAIILKQQLYKLVHVYIHSTCTSLLLVREVLAEWVSGTCENYIL